VSRTPPMACRPPSRGLGSGRWFAAASVLVAVLAGGACATKRDESRAGLVITSIGQIGVTDDNGQPATIDGPAEDVRFVTASSGRIAASTTGGRVFVSDAPGAGEARAWRTLALDESSSRTPSGLDLSPDGRVLAIVLGDPDTPGLELVTIDVEANSTAVRSIDLMSNGPPSWLRPELIGLEVVRPDQHSGIATVNTTSGEVTVTEAQGFSPSVTGDGSRMAIADPATGRITIGDPASWIAGVPNEDSGINAPIESSVQDVAIDADGSRLAVVYAANSDAFATVVILRRTGTGWERVSSIPVRGDAPVSIDWLD
jgi:hypothetical protein